MKPLLRTTLLLIRFSLRQWRSLIAPIWILGSAYLLVRGFLRCSPESWLNSAGCIPLHSNILDIFPTFMNHSWNLVGPVAIGFALWIADGLVRLREEGTLWLLQLRSGRTFWAAHMLAIWLQSLLFMLMVMLMCWLAGLLVGLPFSLHDSIFSHTHYKPRENEMRSLLEIVRPFQAPMWTLNLFILFYTSFPLAILGLCWSSSGLFFRSTLGSFSVLSLWVILFFGASEIQFISSSSWFYFIPFHIPAFLSYVRPQEPWNFLFFSTLLILEGGLIYLLGRIRLPQLT